MLAWVMRIIVMFGVLTVIYIALSRYQRWEERRKLEAEYDADPRPDEDRESYVAQGMHEYDSSLKRTLLIGVYGLPAAALIILFLIAEYG
jgi:uncharacterized iron-regulated membrane protein